MKKLIGLFAIVTMFLSVETVKAQTFTRLKQAAPGDTILKSTTIFTSAVNLNTNDLQGLSLQVAMDSVSGTPDAKFVLQRSVDGVHWLSVAGDTLSPSYKGINTVHPGTSVQLNVNPFYGTYARVKIYTSSTTQKSKLWAAIKTATIR